MTDPRSVARGILVYSLCLPLALVLGYMLATPLSLGTFVMVGLVLAALSFPILLRWHHPLLVFSWNTIAVLPFLPGRPQVRLALVGASLLITWLMYALDRRMRPQNAPSITWPLMFLATVVVVTAQLTGGAGFGALGSQVGGAGRYVALLGAILGYFALSARPIPLAKANLYVGLFFLGGLTLIISSLPRVVPRSFQFLFLFFPMEQTPLYGSSPSGLGMMRVYGIAVACMTGMFYMLARYGLRGIFSTVKPWRALVFLGLVAGIMSGGYRSFAILTLGVIAVQFYLEGFFKMRFLPAWLVLAALLAALLPVVNRMPYQMQRSLAWIPGIVAPEVAADARGSTKWRLEMWRRMISEVPQYLLVGKGYAMDLRDLEMVQFRSRFGAAQVAEGSELAGDYHSGPLTVLIPFGVFGVIGVVWFWIAGWRLLLHHYRYGPPELKLVNACLFSLFCGRVFYFVFIFGSLHTEFIQFAGVVGLSVALNGVSARSRLAVAEETEPRLVRSRVHRAAMPPPVPARG